MSKFKTIYDHANPVSPHGGVSMTDQQYLKECDINHVLDRFRVTGSVPAHVDKGDGVSGDFSDIGDFQSCLDRINRAKDSFSALPSRIRDRFGNDPRAYVEFVLNPANTQECIRLGIKSVNAPKKSVEDILESIDSKLVTPKKEDNPAS